MRCLQVNLWLLPSSFTRVVASKRATERALWLATLACRLVNSDTGQPWIPSISRSRSVLGSVLSTLHGSFHLILLTAPFYFPHFLGLKF